MKSKEILDRLVKNWPAKVLSIAAAVIIFMFYRVSSLQERYFSVPLHILLDEHFIPSGSYPKAVRIALRGKGENIFLIQEDDIDATADLTRYQNEGIFRVPVHVEKKGSALYADALEVQVDPIEVTVTLEKKMSKSVEVVPNIKGYPSAGFELVQYSVTPSAVDAVGPSGKVQRLESVSTEEIDLKERDEDFVIRIRLDKSDPLIDFPGGDVVEFRGVIREATVLRSFTVGGLIFLDLKQGLSVADESVTGLVRVQGSQNSLQTVADQDVKLIVDCSKIAGPGTYTLPVKVDVPQELIVLKYEPAEIVVHIEEEP